MSVGLVDDGCGGDVKVVLRGEGLDLIRSPIYVDKRSAKYDQENHL
jgi:hypothetical protein